VALQLQVALAVPAGAVSACNGAFQGSPSGTLAMTASVPNGGSISPGQSITITITWDTGDWSGLDALYDCFTVNGALDDSLTYGEKPPSNDGIAQHSVTVPNSLLSGDTICARARLSGQPIGGVSTQKGNILCWTVGGTTTNPDVKVTKSASSTNVTFGDTVTFAIEASNIGNAAATNVQIKDTIPAGLTITGTSASCSTSGQAVTCNVGDIAQGGSKSVTITVKVTDAACPSVDNKATVSATNEPAGNTGNNTSNTVTLNVSCPQPDVKVTKGTSKTSVNSGDSFTFTIEASNVGGGTANNVVITDTVPNGLTITGTSGSCTTSGQKVTCNVGDITAGGSKSITIDVKATDAACPQVSNSATVSAGNEPAANQGNNASNVVKVDVICATPDVKVTKSASTTSVNAGGSVTFTIEAKNVGGGTANNVAITDTIPSGLTITGTSASCTTSGQKVTCNVGDIAAGGTKSVTITVTATAVACPEVSNFASVSAGNEPAGNTGNNTSNTVKVTVVCPNPDVSIRKSSDAPNGGVQPGDSFTYTITVNSVGGATANNVVVSDTIPAGLTITGTSNACSVSGQNVTCALGNLAGGDHASVTITVKATDGACPEVDNHATVTSSNEPAANTGNNTSNHVTTIVNCIEPGIAIKIVKTNDANGDGTFTDNEEARRAGLDVPFKLVIINTGTPDLRITDLADAFSQTTLDLLNDKCPGLSGKVLSSGESVTCTFTVNNYSPAATSGGLVNTAEVCGENMTGDKTDCDNDTSKVRSAEVLGKTITPTPPGGTAFTGSDDAVGFGSVALFLLMLGSGLTYLGYRRRARFDG
jgi:uncharacterized repeat protein (TIGR01451 family)